MSVDAFAPSLPPVAAPSPVPRQPRPSRSQPPGSRSDGWGLGRYREIVVAVAFFLLFDLGVLVLNFYTSFKIDQDTVAINLAGRQRYVSQRIARTLLELDAAHAAGAPYRPETLAELRAAARVFQDSHLAFREGGTVPGGDGRPVFLAAVTSPQGRALEDKVEEIWRPYQQRLQPLLADDRFSAEQLAAALAYSQTHNLRLLDIANDFVSETQRIGASRAGVLRLVQAGGIVLALLNFLFILFKFVRRMRRADAALEAANEENREILSAVQEGLFLLTRDMRLGTQISSSVGRMFGGKVNPGDDFLALLQPLVSEKALEDARSYVELLFSEHVREHLVQGINPLTEVELQMTNRLGQKQSRHLSFRFRRVQAEGGALAHLLVTVQDVTPLVELQRKLDEEREKAQKEFGLLTKTLEIEADTLRAFIERSEAALLEVNNVLRSISNASGPREVLRAVELMYRSLHAFKGEASMLGLDLLASSAHRFESLLQALRENDELRGEALLAIPLPLEELLGRLQTLRRLLVHAPTPTAERTDRFVQRLGELAQRIAGEAGKQVRLETALPGFERLALEKRTSLSGIAIQLVRNAVAHGIEAPSHRQAAGKPAEGTVKVSFAWLEDEGEVGLEVHDDGIGLSPQRVRRRLLELGWFSEEQLRDMPDSQVINQIFRSGFSTAGEAGEHSGRGVGLDVVSAQIRALGARLTLSSQRGRGTTFRVRLPA